MTKNFIKKPIVYKIIYTILKINLINFHQKIKHKILLIFHKTKFLLFKETKN